MSRPLFIVPEHEFEAQPGLPEPLPKGEVLLWQGSPEWRTLAVQAFHVRKLAVYFAIILLLRTLFVLSEGGNVVELAISLAILTPLAGISVGLMAFMAWLTARTSMYTITDQRIVMRIGIVLSVTFNLPFKSLDSVGLKRFTDGTGDLALTIGAKDHIAYLHLWPHARPWKFAKPEPMLRSIAEVATVANTLSQAMKAAAGGVAITIKQTQAPAAEANGQQRDGWATAA
jgi:hypothetical protein